MSNRSPYETKAIEVFIEHLRSSGNGDYRVEAEHVPVGRKNCDFLLAPLDGSDRKIAVEVVRVVDNPADMQQQSFRDIHWEVLTAELKALGVAGVLVRTPWSIRAAPHKTKKLAVQLARDIKAALDAAPDAKTVTVSGHEVVRIADLPGIVPSATSGMHLGNNRGHTDVLLSMLEDKDAQVALPGVERVLLAVEWNTDLDAETVVRELARRADLERLCHADRAFFIDRSGTVAAIYSREVRDFFSGSGVFPVRDGEMVAAWFSTRLTDNHAGAFELVRATYEARGRSLHFLGTEGREALAHHATRLVESGQVGDALWVVRELIADPDPTAGTRVSSGLISTVRGTTAWLLHRVAAAVGVHELPEVTQMTEALATDPNSYVRGMAAFALCVLMARRDELSNGGFVVPHAIRSNVKRIWWDYLNRAPADGLADEAASTLSFVYDLTESEVLQTLTCLLEHVTQEGMRDLARSALYFSELRGTDTGVPTAFQPDTVRARVRELIASSKTFREEVSFVLFRSMTDHPEVRGSTADLVPFLLDLEPVEPSGFVLQCVAMLALDGFLTPTTEAKALEHLARARTLEPSVRMGLGFMLEHACRPLVTAGQTARVQEWLRLLGDDEVMARIRTGEVAS